MSCLGLQLLQVLLHRHMTGVAACRDNHSSASCDRLRLLGCILTISQVAFSTTKQAGLAIASAEHLPPSRQGPVHGLSAKQGCDRQGGAQSQSPGLEV